MKNIKNSNFVPVLSVLLLTIIWGYNWVVMKQSVQLLGPWEFGFIRNFFGAIFLFIALILLKKPLKLENPVFVFIIGAFQMVGFTVLVLIALVNGGTAKISVLTFTMPIWANILAYIFLKEKLALSQWLAILISAFGLMMIFDPIHVLADFNSMAIAILSGFFWACGAILFKRYNSKYPHSDLLNLTAWQMLLGCIPIVLYILFKGIEVYEVNNYLIGASLYNAFFCNAVAWILWLYGVKHLKTSSVSILSLLAPVIGSLAAFIELGETPLPNELIGLVLILGGIAFMMILGLRSTSR